MNSASSSSVASRGVLVDGFIRPAARRSLSPSLERPQIASPSPEADMLPHEFLDKSSPAATDVVTSPIQPQVRKKHMASLQIGQGYLIALHVLLFAGATVTLAVLGFQFTNLLLPYFLLVIILRLNSRYIFASALFALIMTPAAVAAKQENFADGYAALAYMLLVLGTARIIWEFYQERKERSITQKGFDWPKA